MKTFLTIIFLLLTSFLFGQQNLVLNSSFEDTVACPYSTNQTNYALDWDIDINSSDYYNSCRIYHPAHGIGVPLNGLGYQCPANGDAYVGFYGVYKNTLPRQYREYFGRRLTQPLIIGQKYFISIKFNLANYSNCATNKIGIKFTNVNYGRTSFYEAPVMNNSASFYANSIISDTSSWTSVSGAFIADSSYQFFLIGNFFDDNNIDTIRFDNDITYAAYYYVDDICISTDSATCIIPNNINTCDTNESISIVYSEDFTIYPNPAQNELTVKAKLKSNAYFVLIDLLGAKRKVVSLDLNSNYKKIDLTELSSGLYFFTILDKYCNIIKSGKLDIQK